MPQRRTAAGQFALEEQRRRLVAAASEAILEQGLSNVTLSHIAAGAGISTGSVNFYFNSKEELLIETLRSVTDEFYRSAWHAVEAAGASPGDRLRALVMASTDPAIIKPGSAAVRYAFMSEAKTRREYQEICARHDDQFHFLILDLCRAVIDCADPPVSHNPDVIALAISGLIDLAWQGVLFDREGFDGQQIRMQCMSFLSTVFPWMFVPDAPGNLLSREFGRMDIPVTIRPCGVEDVPALAGLMNAFRQQQGAPSDLPGATQWSSRQMGLPHTAVLVAEDPAGTLRGFAYILRGECPVMLAPYGILRALFVDGDLRRGGIGQALLLGVRAACAGREDPYLEIECPSDNAVAKALYLSSGAQESGCYARLLLPIKPVP